MLSRGLAPNKLKECELWWAGPRFLQQACEFEKNDVSDVILLPEERPIKLVLNNVLADENFNIIERYSLYPLRVRGV